MFLSLRGAEIFCPFIGGTGLVPLLTSLCFRAVCEVFLYKGSFNSFDFSSVRAVIKKFLYKRVVDCHFWSNLRRTLLFVLEHKQSIISENGLLARVHISKYYPGGYDYQNCYHR
jgi:hypothetical protein